MPTQSASTSSSRRANSAPTPYPDAWLLWHELVHTIQAGSTATLRRQAGGAKAKQADWKVFSITIPTGVTTLQQYRQPLPRPLVLEGKGG